MRYFVSYFLGYSTVVFCHRLRRGNLARIIIYACIILFMSVSNNNIYCTLYILHTRILILHTPEMWGHVALVDILFQNLPFCIYFDLMLPSMSFQCTVYFHVENLNMRFTFENICTHKSFGLFVLFLPSCPSRNVGNTVFRFVLVFACSHFI